MIGYVICFIAGMLAGAYVVIAWALSAAQKYNNIDISSRDDDEKENSNIEGIEK